MTIRRAFNRVNNVVKARRSRRFDEVVDFAKALFSAFTCGVARQNRSGICANGGARIQFAQIVLFFDVCQSLLFGLLLIRKKNFISTGSLIG